MNLSNANDEMLSQSSDIARIVVGAGAVGVFFAHRLKIDYPNDSLFINSRTKLPKKILLKIPNEKQKEINIPEVLEIYKINNKLLVSNYKKLIFYNFLPPEEMENFFKIVEKSLIKINYKTKIIITYLSNGILRLELFEELKSKLEKIGIKKIKIIRGIIISGFMREIHSDKVIITNTSGNEIFWEKSSEKNTFPKSFFKNTYKKNILKLEKAKFFTNFVLGITINKNLLKNNEIFNIIDKKTLEDAIAHFCNIFNYGPHFINYVANYFYHTIDKTGENINSISYAWNQGNSKTIDFFISELFKLIKKYNIKSSKTFFDFFVGKFY